jgi:hypothetical protein
VELTLRFYDGVAMSNPSGAFDIEGLIAELRSLLKALPTELADMPNLTTGQRRQLRANIEQAIEGLQRILSSLDPIRLPPYILDPSNPEIVGKLIADTLLVQERHRLQSVPKFYGSGVYALYYSGHFDAYEPIRGTEHPIYVGKADPATHGATSAIEQGTRLWSRLSDHRKSISAAENLGIDDFDCRYLVVKSAWQGTAETYLIERFSPIWNNETGICYGFGKHGDDPGTRSNTRSPWDTLHPGRKWALKEGNRSYNLSTEEIKARIAVHFRQHPINK